MALFGKAAAHSARGLAPFDEAPPLGLFQQPPINPKTGQRREGVWSYKLAVDDGMANLVRELRCYCKSAEERKRLPLVREYSSDDLGGIDNSGVDVILPTNWHSYLYWEDKAGRALARWVYTNMPEEIAWEGGELHLRESRLVWMETKKGVLRRHVLSASGHRVEG